MQELVGERTLMRIHLTEGDTHRGRPMYQSIVELLRERHFAGATVLRGSMSFGAECVVHTDRIEVMSYDMPLLIECVDTEEKIRSILPELDALLGGSLITLERAEVIVYRAGGAAGESDAGRDA